MDDPTLAADRLGTFQRHRSLLFTVAYRMLGSASDAEDAVQDTWLRWEAARADVREPRAYLVRTVTRLCLDQLGSARARREQYVGPWLPEPVLTDGPDDPFEHAARAEQLHLGALLLLERLTPAERAVFVLRDGLDLPYDEIADILGVSAANARQLLHRARGRVADGSPRFAVDSRTLGRLAEALRDAFNTGRFEPLVDLLHEDVVLVSDGGGRARAALRPIAGAAKVFRFIRGVTTDRDPDLHAEVRTVNGVPAVVMSTGGEPRYVVVVGVAGGLVTDVLVVANPDKLAFASRQHGG